VDTGYCTKCKERKLKTSFYRSSTRGVTAWCKDCYKKSYTANRLNRIAKQKQREQRYREKYSANPSNKEGQKECCTCHRTLPCTRFSRVPSRRDGLEKHCYDCNNIRRNARRNGCRVDGLTSQLWENRLNEYSGCCYCGDINVPRTKDHFIPLNLNGSNHIDNIVPACRRCNSSKGRCNPYEWVRERFGENHPMMKFTGRENFNP
jgi:hypothetical protein